MCLIFYIIYIKTKLKNLILFYVIHPLNVDICHVLYYLNNIFFLGSKTMHTSLVASRVCSDLKHSLVYFSKKYSSELFLFKNGSV